MDEATSPEEPMAGSPPSFEVFGRRYEATMSTAQAAELLGCSVERLQQQRGKGTLSVEPLELGRRLRWPTLLVVQAIGVEVEGRTAQMANGLRSTPSVSGPAQRLRQRTHCRADRPGAA